MTITDVVGAYCAARGCPHKRLEKFIMCRQHWEMVPMSYRRRVIRAVGKYLRNSKGHARTALRIAVDEARSAVAAAQSAPGAAAPRISPRTLAARAAEEAL